MNGRKVMTKETHVLFLDDEESILRSLQRLFVSEPYGIFTTTSVDQARDILSKEKVKVVVSDQRMSEMQGVKFLQEVKERHPDMIRILFTGYTDFLAAEEAVNVGEIYRFISKPWETMQLLSTIRQSIEQYDLIVEARTRTQELEIANKELKAMYEIQKEFTLMVFHELGPSLASIKAGMDLAMKKAGGPADSAQERVLGLAKENADRLKRFIDDILDLTRIESGRLQMNFRMNDIHSLIQEVAEAHRDIARSRGLYIRTALDSDVPHIPFDRDRLIQVLNHLVDNAVKVTHQGGIILKIQNKSKENHVVVSVIDTGKGIAEGDLPKLFPKFQKMESTHENEGDGTRLELVICREIVTLHGGKIWAESEVGRGTAISFLLPVQERRSKVVPK
jgi:signal transduction histidine kinase